MKNFILLLVLVILFPALKTLADDPSIPPDIEKQFDPDVLSGKRPKTVVLMQSMILNLANQPKLDADVVTLGFTYSSLSAAQKTALGNWFQTGSNKVYLDLAPSNIFETPSSRTTAPLPTDLITRLFRYQISWVGDKSLVKHPVNTGCEKLSLGYFHDPRDAWAIKEGDVVELTGFAKEGAETIINGKNGMVAGKFIYGKTECYFLGAALGGPARERWEKNLWQWVLGMKVPGAENSPATQPAAKAP